MEPGRAAYVDLSSPVGLDDETVCISPFPLLFLAICADIFKDANALDYLMAFVSWVVFFVAVILVFETVDREG